MKSVLCRDNSTLSYTGLSGFYFFLPQAFHVDLGAVDRLPLIPLGFFAASWNKELFIYKWKLHA